MIATIELKDEVNCKIHGLSAATRKKLQEKFSFILPHAYHVPSFKLGRWDGKTTFFTFGALTYVALLEDILPILLDEGYEVELQDERVRYQFDLPQINIDHFADKNWPKGHPVEGEPVMLRDYQQKVINQFLDNPMSIQEIATGAGKTLITAALSQIVEQSLSQDDQFIHKLGTGSSVGRTIVIVPNKGLVTQTEEDYINLGLDVGVYFGDRKDFGKTHTICTWQSLERIHKTFKDGESELSLEEFSEGVIALIVDETHQAKADVLKKLLTGPFKNVPLRWGLTGTIPKAEHEQMGIKVSLGSVVGELAASTLQEEGILSNCHVDVIQMVDDVLYDNYQNELTYLTTDSKRLDYIAETILQISESGNTLVLVDRIAAGQGLVDRLPADRTVLVSGQMKNDSRRDHYKEIASSDNKIIVATYGVAAVGINVPRIFNMVLLEPGKSFVRVIQSIGRGLRKAKDKDFVNIYDFTSTAKFSKRHLTSRKKFYKDANYPYKILKVDWRKDTGIAARFKQRQNK
jgi:superfamily II DNA or RNA helicase